MSERRIIGYRVEPAYSKNLAEILHNGWEPYGSPVFDGGDGSYQPGVLQAFVLREPEDGPWIIENSHGRYRIIKKDGAYEIEPL